MPFQIKIAASALKSLSAIPRHIQRQIVRRIGALRDDPLPSGSKKLHSAQSLYRIRSGDYRILYQIDNDQILVLVLRIAHRRDAYKNLEG
jgi:mRNA interferase RelE/StbE